MGMKARIGGSWQDISAGKVRVSNAWRPLVAIKGFVGGTWRDLANLTVINPFSISLNTTSVNRLTSTSTGTTTNVTATPSGGLSPFTYSWTRTLGFGISATFPNAATTSFTATGLVVDEVRTATFRVLCTDSLGSSDTKDVSVTIRRIESTGGTNF